MAKIDGWRMVDASHSHREITPFDSQERLPVGLDGIAARVNVAGRAAGEFPQPRCRVDRHVLPMSVPAAGVKIRVVAASSRCGSDLLRAGMRRWRDKVQRLLLHRRIDVVSLAMVQIPIGLTSDDAELSVLPLAGFGGRSKGTGIGRSDGGCGGVCGSTFRKYLAAGARAVSWN